MAGALLMVAALIFWPYGAMAVEDPPGAVPPAGTLVIAVGVSDGMVLLPAGITAIAGIECGPS